MSNSSNAEKYLTHCAGIYTMLAWLEKQNTLGTGSKIANQTVYVPPLGSRYFALGSSNHKKSKFPFLCIQPNESQWMKMISWDYMVTRKEDLNLYLVSSIIKGDDSEYPDIPSFALAINFDDFEKLQPLTKFNKIEGREFFIDTNNAIRINYHQKMFTLPIKHLDKYEEYLNNDAVTNYTDLLSKKEHYLQSVFSTDAPPTFLGGIADIPETKSLFEKLKDKLL